MAVYSNIEVDQGSEFYLVIQITDANGDAFDLTNYSARSMMRKSYASATYYNIVATVLNPPTDGKVQLYIPATQSNGMRRGRYYYDVEVYTANDADVQRAQEGQININPNITRSYTDDVEGGNDGSSSFFLI